MADGDLPAADARLAADNSDPVVEPAPALIGGSHACLDDLESSPVRAPRTGRRANHWSIVLGPSSPTIPRAFRSPDRVLASPASPINGRYILGSLGTATSPTLASTPALGSATERDDASSASHITLSRTRGSSPVGSGDGDSSPVPPTSSSRKRERDEDDESDATSPPGLTRRRVDAIYSPSRTAGTTSSTSRATHGHSERAARDIKGMERAADVAPPSCGLELQGGAAARPVLPSPPSGTLPPHARPSVPLRRSPRNASASDHTEGSSAFPGAHYVPRGRQPRRETPGASASTSAAAPRVTLRRRENARADHVLVEAAEPPALAPGGDLAPPAPAFNVTWADVSRDDARFGFRADAAALPGVDAFADEDGVAAAAAAHDPYAAMFAAGHDGGGFYEHQEDVPTVQAVEAFGHYMMPVFGGDYGSAETGYMPWRNSLWERTCTSMASVAAAEMQHSHFRWEAEASARAPAPWRPFSGRGNEGAPCFATGDDTAAPTAFIEEIDDGDDE